jgi:hypothetical protein
MKPSRSIAVRVNLALNCSDEQLRRHFEEFSQRLFLSLADRTLAIDHFRNTPARPEDRHEVCLAQIILSNQKLWGNNIE